MGFLVEAPTIGNSRVVEVLHDRGPAIPVDSDRWTGASGYLIGGRLVLTAAHAIDYRRDLGDDEQLLVRTIEGSEFPAQVLLVCDEPSQVDLALLKISAPSSMKIYRLSFSCGSIATARHLCRAAGRSGFPSSAKLVPSCRAAVVGRPGRSAATSCPAGNCDRDCFPCR